MITREQFGLWKHEPVTRWFFQYLRDKADFMTKSATDQWLEGKPWPETVRGQIVELIETLAIEHEFIKAFYEEKENAEGRE